MTEEEKLEYCKSHPWAKTCIFPERGGQRHEIVNPYFSYPEYEVEYAKSFKTVFNRYPWENRPWYTWRPSWYYRLKCWWDVEG